MRVLIISNDHFLVILHLFVIFGQKFKLIAIALCSFFPLFAVALQEIKRGGVRLILTTLGIIDVTKIYSPRGSKIKFRRRKKEFLLSCGLYILLPSAVPIS